MESVNGFRADKILGYAWVKEGDLRAELIRYVSKLYESHEVFTVRDTLSSGAL